MPVVVIERKLQVLLYFVLVLAFWLYAFEALKLAEEDRARARVEVIATSIFNIARDVISCNASVIVLMPKSIAGSSYEIFVDYDEMEIFLKRGPGLKYAFEAPSEVRFRPAVLHPGQTYAFVCDEGRFVLVKSAEGFAGTF